LQGISRQANVFLKSRAEFWDNAVYVGLGPGRKGFGAKLVDTGFGMSGHCLYGIEQKLSK